MVSMIELGREDQRVLDRFKGVEAHVAAALDQGMFPQDIAGGLNVRYRTTVFSGRWVESMKRRIDRARAGAGKG
jgi:hypothetical protein